MDGALIQGSEAWLQARVGSLGASRVADALATTKSGWGASRANLAAELMLERLTGQPTPTFVNDAMRRGTEMEPHARQAYARKACVEVLECGLIRHPEIAWTHASPDGLVGDAGMVELKCPTSATHLETLTTGRFPERYVKQCLWQMACAGRGWVDLVSFDDRFPEAMQIVVQRIEWDASAILALEHEVAVFLAEVEIKVEKLRQTYAVAA